MLHATVAVYSQGSVIQIAVSSTPGWSLRPSAEPGGVPVVLHQPSCCDGGDGGVRVGPSLFPHDVPYVRCQKRDKVDVRASLEAAGNACGRPVPVKSVAAHAESGQAESETSVFILWAALL